MPPSFFSLRPAFLKRFAKALRAGVQVDLVIGVQYPLCAGLTAFWIQSFSSLR